MKITTVMLTLTFLLGCTAAHPAAVSSKLGIIQPYKGTYYDPNQSGSGMQFDVGPSGNTFIAFQTYDEAGNQVNYLTQPLYRPSSEADLIAGKGIGTASGTFYQASDGQCPGCAYRPPVLTITSVQANFVWADPRHVTMTFGTSAFHFVAGNFEGKDDGEFLAGTWSVALLNDNSVYPGEGPQYQTTLPTALSIMQVAPAPFTMAQLTRDPSSSADIQLPPGTAQLFVLKCVGNQDGADDGACNEIELIWTNAVPGSQHGNIARGSAQALLWYDSASSTGGVDIYRPQTDGSAIIGPANFHGQLFVQPDLMQAHLVAMGPPRVAAVTDGTDGIALTFTRLPATTVRDCYDYVTPSCN